MKPTTRVAGLTGCVIFLTLLGWFLFSSTADPSSSDSTAHWAKPGNSGSLLRYLPSRPAISAPTFLTVKKLGIETALERLLQTCPGVEEVEHEDIELVSQLSHRTYHWVYEAKRRSNGARVVIRLLTRPGFFARELDVTARLCRKCSKGMNYATGVVKAGVWFDGSNEIYEGRGIMYPHLSDMLPLQTAMAPSRVNGRLPELLFFQFTAQLLNLIQCMHSQGVMHRDMKTSNVFARVQHGQLEAVEIIDFGSAQLADTTESHVLMVGTMQFKPPDLMLGLRKYTHSIDIWETGVLLGNLLLGSPKLPGMWALPQVASTQDGAKGAAKGQRRMLEKHAALLGSGCVLETVEKYFDKLDLGRAPAFKGEAHTFARHFFERIRKRDIHGDYLEARRTTTNRLEALKQPDAVTLAMSMLVCDPKHRPTAHQLLLGLQA